MELKLAYKLLIPFWIINIQRSTILLMYKHTLVHVLVLAEEVFLYHLELIEFNRDFVLTGRQFDWSSYILWCVRLILVIYLWLGGVICYQDPIVWFVGIDVENKHDILREIIHLFWQLVVLVVVRLMLKLLVKLLNNVAETKLTILLLDFNELLLRPCLVLIVDIHMLLKSII